jgi:flotillin
VAEKNRDGSIGEANANKEKRISVSAADALAKVGEATAGANSLFGENEALVRIANSNAERRQREAEALSLATASEKIQAARALKESYTAERDAELARADRERATREADAIVQSEIAKRKVEIDAEAEAERTRRIARGEADAIFMQKEAEANGLYQMLQKQANGFEEVVKAAGGNPKDAVMMLIADKLPELLRIQVDAIKNIKIDKVTVWEGGGQDGTNNTTNFIAGMYKSVPPLNELFNMAGMDLPSFLGKEKQEHEAESEEVKMIDEKKK